MSTSVANSKAAKYVQSRLHSHTARAHRIEEKENPPSRSTPRVPMMQAATIRIETTSPCDGTRHPAIVSNPGGAGDSLIPHTASPSNPANFPIAFALREIDVRVDDPITVRIQGRCG